MILPALLLSSSVGSSGIGSPGASKGVDDGAVTAAFSEDGRRLAVGGRGWVDVWDVGSGRRLRASRVPWGDVSGVRFDSASKVFGLVLDEPFRLDVASGKLHRLDASFPDVEEVGRSLPLVVTLRAGRPRTVGLDGRTIRTIPGSWDEARLWEARRSLMVWKDQDLSLFDVRGRGKPIAVPLALKPSADPSRAGLPGMIVAAAGSPNRRSLLVLSWDKDLFLVNAQRASRPVWSKPLRGGFSARGVSFSFDRTGRTILLYTEESLSDVAASDGRTIFSQRIGGSLGFDPVSSPTQDRFVVGVGPDVVLRSVASGVEIRRFKH